MARTFSTGDQDVLNAAKYQVYTRVEVANSTGAFKNLNDLGGSNWVDSVTWGWDLDQPVPELRVRLTRDYGNQSLSPLHETSTLNVTDASTAYSALIDAGREIRVFTATVAAGAAEPSTADYQWMFQGEVDDVSFGDTPLELVARSKLMGQLADRWVENRTVYGSTSGTPLHTVMQSILTDWTDGVTLVVPSTPTALVPRYEQTKMPVWQAIQTLAQLIGWDVRELWDGSTWALTLYEPNRAASTVDVAWTFGANHYYDVTQLGISRDDIRNVVSVTYTDLSSDKRRTTETVSATSSIDRWGRRWMEMEEGDDSPISSSSEANAFATAALNDLQDPQADHEIELPYWWVGELQDYLEFTANDTHYTTDQLFAVYGIRHTLTPQRQRTFVKVRGKPAGQYLGWHINHVDRKPTDPGEQDDWFRLLNFRRVVDTDANTVQFLWDWGALVQQCWINVATVASPEAADTFDNFDPDSPTAVVDRDADLAQYTVTGPASGYAVFLQFVPRSVTGVAGPVIRAVVNPITEFTVDDIGAGSIAADKLTQQARSFITDVEFSSSNYQQVDWSSGTLTMANGDSYSISSGNTGTMSGLTYIYFDPTVSTTTLLVTTSIASAIGDDIILVCVGKPSSISTSRAFFVPGVGVFGLTRDQLAPDSIGTTQISDSAISTPKLAANSVTAAKIGAGEVKAGKIAAGAVDTNELAANAVTAAKINGLEIEGYHIAGNTISAGKLTSLTGGGLTINFGATGGNPVLSHAKFSLNADGTASFSGGLSAASGTFAGDLDAASGNMVDMTLKGTLYFQSSGGTPRGNIDTATSGSVQVNASGGSYQRWFGGIYMQTAFGASVTIGDPGGTSGTFINTYNIKLQGNTTVASSISQGVGFYGWSPVTRQSVSGSRGGNAALANLLTALDNMGLVANNTSA